MDDIVDLDPRATKLAQEPLVARTPRGLRNLIFAGLGGIAVGLVAALAFAWAFLPSNQESLPTPPDFSKVFGIDSATVTYIGSFQTADFWVGTKSAGQYTCLIVSDPTDSVASGSTCRATDEVDSRGIIFEETLIDPVLQVPVQKIFVVQLGDNGAFRFSVSSMTVGSDASFLPRAELGCRL